MRRWFLSYTSQDFALTQALKAGLQHVEPDAHIFFAPESMRAGGFWLPQLAEEIAESTAFVMLVGETGIGPWQVMEYYEALDRRVKEPNYPVILILSAKRPAPGLPFVGQLHWVLTEDPTSEATVGQLIAAASEPATRPGELWRHTRPYRGLEAMTEANSDFFFGRGRETVEVINALASERGKLPVLLGNSGVGKSSLAQAGVLASLLRQGWPEHVKDAGPWPVMFDHSRHWCFLTLRPGTEPIRALVEPFIRAWQFDATDARREERLNEWVDRLQPGKATLRGLLDATQDRLREMGQLSPTSFFLYIDQGEELYIRAEKQQRRRFSEIIAAGLADPRLRALISLRADFFGELQKDDSLYAAHRQINVAPLREAALYGIVGNPAKLLSARFETDTLAADIARRTAEESAEDAGALPLLSYLLDDMWSEMVRRGDGVLRLPMQAIELGRVLVERANRFVAEHPASEDALRRILTLKLATVREDSEPTRRRALRSEFSEDEWKLVSELADNPNRLLVTATPEGGETYAEVAHEAIFRRWDKLREWIAAEREFLAWRSGLEAASRAWQGTPEASKQDALLMGAALTQAQSWHATRAEDLPRLDREFIALSIAREERTQARARRVRALVYVLLVGMIVGLVGWIEQSYIKDEGRYVTVTLPYWYAHVRGHVLTVAQEQALKPGDPFKECATDCPEMIVVPAGSFTMGGPTQAEQPPHAVTFSKPFAVSKYELTFADWDACVKGGGCNGYKPADQGWGRGRQPAINVDWDDAQAYVAWLSQVTGKTYRLLSEAEYEYATRAGTTTAYPWGDDIKLNGQAMANCDGCGSKWDNQQTAPVGSFYPNEFGLYDMVGNVLEWTKDCVHKNYNDAPADGSAWLQANGGDCTNRILRGGSWDDTPAVLRSANRGRGASGTRNGDIGFRLGRTLLTP